MLDSSALVDVLVDQAHAGWLLDQLASGEVLAPNHQPAEVGSAVARLQRAGALTADTQRDALTAAMALPQQLVPAPRRYSERSACETASGCSPACTWRWQRSVAWSRRDRLRRS